MGEWFKRASDDDRNLLFRALSQPNYKYFDPVRAAKAMDLPIAGLASRNNQNE